MPNRYCLLCYTRSMYLLSWILKSINSEKELLKQNLTTAWLMKYILAMKAWRFSYHQQEFSQTFSIEKPKNVSPLVCYAIFLQHCIWAL